MPRATGSRPITARRPSAVSTARLACIEPVFRIQQTFRRDTIVSDGLPPVNAAQRADFGLDYNLPHNIKDSYKLTLGNSRPPAITMFGRQGSFTVSSFPPGKENDDELVTLDACCS